MITTVKNNWWITEKAFWKMTASLWLYWLAISISMVIAFK